MTGRVLFAWVARPSHSSFLNAALSAALLSLMLLSGDVQSTTTNGYRLAGVVAVGKDYLGLLELPGGTQVLVREGSVIEGSGRIVHVGATAVRISFPTGFMDLSLEASGILKLGVAPSIVVREQSDIGNVLTRSVDTAGFIAAAGASRIEPGSTTASVAGSRRLEPQTEAARRLALFLNLPPNSRVVAVNERPVVSAEQAIAVIEDCLRQGVSPRLNLAGATNGEPETRVYLSPVLH